MQEMTSTLLFWIKSMSVLQLTEAALAMAVFIFLVSAVILRSGRRKKSGVKKDEKETVEGKGQSKSGRKKSIQSTQELSPIAGIIKGVVVTKDGDCFKILEYSPINFNLLSLDEQDAIIRQFSSLIRIWPKMIHMKIISAKADLQPFINDLENCKRRELDAGNRNCADLIQDQINMLRELAEVSGVTRRFFIILRYEAEGGFKKRPSLEEITNALNHEARTISAALEACGNFQISSDSRDYILKVFYTVMAKGAADLYSYEDRKKDILLKYQTANHGVPVPADHIPVNDFICPVKIDTSLSPRYIVVDGKYITYAFIPSEAYPAQCVGGWMSIIFNYMDGTDVDFWIRKEPIEAIQRKLSFELKNNKIKRRQTEDTSQDYDDILSAIESGYYIKTQLANGDEFCYMSTIITIEADSLEELNSRYTAMYNHLIRNDLMLRRLTFQQEKAYRLCIPAAVMDESVFRKSKRNIMATQLGSCYPFTAFDLNDKGGIFLGINDDYGSPVMINTFDTKKFQNANMIILGPSGSGKSFSLMCMLLRMRQRGLQIFVIAPLKGFEFYRACSAIGGEFIRIAPGSTQNINIMEIRKKDTSDSQIIDGITENSSGSIVTDKVQQLARFFTLLLPDMDTTEKQILDDCLVKTYEKFGMYTRSNKSLLDARKGSGEYKEMPVLGDLLKTLEEYDRDNPDMQARRLRGALQKFVTGSARSFNLPTNVRLDNKYIVLDVSDLTPEMLPIGMFIALDFVMDKAKQDRTKRKVIAIDEMWRLMKASQLSAEFVVEVFKIIRGYAGACIGATQDLDDVLKNEYGAAIINNAKIKLLLPMDKKEADAAAEVIDLTGNEMAKLKRTTLTDDGGGRRALIVANNNHVFVRVKASQKEFDLITTDAGELNRQKQAFLNKNAGGK